MNRRKKKGQSNDGTGQLHGDIIDTLFLSLKEERENALKWKNRYLFLQRFCAVCARVRYVILPMRTPKLMLANQNRSKLILANQNAVRSARDFLASPVTVHLTTVAFLFFGKQQHLCRHTNSHNITLLLA